MVENFAKIPQLRPFRRSFNSEHLLSVLLSFFRLLRAFVLKRPMYEIVGFYVLRQPEPILNLLPLCGEHIDLIHRSILLMVDKGLPAYQSLLVLLLQLKKVHLIFHIFDVSNSLIIDFLEVSDGLKPSLLIFDVFNVDRRQLTPC